MRLLDDAGLAALARTADQREIGALARPDVRVGMGNDWRTEDDRELSLVVVGLPYKNKGPGNREFEAAVSERGETIELRPEPKNPVDPDAVAVFSSRGIQMGYLTEERAGWIKSKLQLGYVARFEYAAYNTATIRIRLGGGEPTLPPAPPPPRPRRDPMDQRRDDDLVDADADFCPDPDGSEWGA